jgi:hypothetical protein
MGIYIDYFISSTPTMNDKTNKTELAYNDGNVIFNASHADTSMISTEKITALTGLVIAPGLFIIQTSWSTYDNHMGSSVIRVI